VEDSALERFDILRSLVALEGEQRVPLLYRVAILLQPPGEDAFFHGPAESRYENL